MVCSISSSANESFDSNNNNQCSDHHDATARPGLCRWPVECSGNAVHDGYCISHKIYSELPEPPKAPRKPIAHHSNKRARDQRAYRKIVAEMLEEDPLCEIKEDGCEILATGLHHQRKRTPGTLLDKRYLKRSCDNCNTWCEVFPTDAIKKGHSHSKF